MSRRPSARRPGSSRPGAPSGRPAAGPDPTADPTAAAAAEVPVVGARQPCPCGSGRRYKACHGSRREVAVLRPFEGRVDEPDWVALRELVPSATAPLALSAEYLADHPEHKDRTVVLGTVLPMAWPALVRADGEVLLATQSAPRGGDPSRELAQALLAALEAEPGSGVHGLPPTDKDGPRLQDLLDPAPLEITVHEGFSWWVTEEVPAEGEVAVSLERADASVVPTQRLTSVDAAYWCRIGTRTHLRWALGEPEEQLLDGFARLAADGELVVGAQSRFAGSFRASGLVVPVWDLGPDVEAADCEEPAKALRVRLDAALAERGPLTPEQRRARAGVVGRQLTLR